ncbi:MAG: hypothetical protein WCQ72_06050, partial [Eubacteriales bacterium]
DGDVMLMLNMKNPSEFTMSLRIPQWTDGDTDILINGTKAAAGKPGTYLQLKRVWNDGDTVSYRLESSFKLTKYKGADEIPNFDRYYIERGPLLYAVSAPTLHEAQTIGWTVRDFDKWLMPSGDGVSYDIKMHPGCSLKPYFLLETNENMTCCPLLS